MTIEEKRAEAVKRFELLNQKEDLMTFDLYTSFDLKNNHDFDNNKLDEILSIISDKIFKDVVIFNKKGNKIERIDFIIKINNQLVLIKLCDYLGNIYFTNKKKVILSFNNQSENIQTKKINPCYELSEFYLSFINYLNEFNNKFKKKEIHQVILFTHNETYVNINKKENGKIIFSNLEILINLINELKKKKSIFEKKIHIDLPTFDKGYQINGDFFNTAIVNPYFETSVGYIPVSDVLYIIFADNLKQEALIVKTNKEEIYASIKLNKLEVYNELSFKKIKHIDALFINPFLHLIKAPWYVFNKEKGDIKDNKKQLYTYLILLVILTAWFIAQIILCFQKQNFLNIFLTIISGLLFIIFFFITIYVLFKILKSKHVIFELIKNGFKVDK